MYKPVGTSLFFCLLLILICSQYSCKSEYRVYKDIIKEYDLAEKLHATIHLDLIQEPNDFLLSGWSQSEKSHRWAEGLESTFRFLAHKGSNITMRVHCSPLFYNNVQQTLSVFLNSGFVNTIALKPQKDIYEIVLPDILLQNGMNSVRFTYAYAKKPCEIRNSQDCRVLSVMFTRIEFDIHNYREAEIELIDGNIRQRPNTFFNYYALLPPNSSLYLELNNAQRDFRGVLQISADGVSSELVQFDRSQSRKIDLSHLANTCIKISFWADTEPTRTEKTESSESQDIEWSNLQLRTPEKNTADTPSPQHLPLKDIQQGLNEYDVIYIVFDAFYAAHSSLYGYHRKTTPFIDTLANEAVVFENMFANASYTFASTGTLFTGKYPHEHGLLRRTNRLNPMLPSINELLLDFNIETSLITSHVLVGNDTWGLTRGFSKRSTIKEFSHPDHIDEIFKTLDIIYTSNSQARKFIYVHLIPPHGPYLPPHEFRIFMEPKTGDVIEPTTEVLRQINVGELQVNDKQLAYIMSLYDANILYADHIAKTIFNYLHNKGILNKSIIFLTSDHGESFMEHGKMLHSSTVFDEMIHIPFLIRFPQEAAIQPKRIHQIASLIDIAPTLADIFGIEPHDNFSGESLLPLIYNNTRSEAFIYSETLLTNSRTIRDLQYKYILSSKDGQMLFNIADDPLEQHNIIDEFPITAGYYRQLMQPFLKRSRIDSSNNEVDINKLSDETIQNLKGLGYIK